MSAERPGPLQSVPTLTEVVDLPEAGRSDIAESAPTAPRSPEPALPQPQAATSLVQDAPEVAESPPVAAETHPASGLPAPAVASPDRESELMRQVLEELQRQVDGVLEYRVREVLAPILARATDTVVREARSELSRSVRDLVAQLVAQELQRQRGR